MRKAHQEESDSTSRLDAALKLEGCPSTGVHVPRSSSDVNRSSTYCAATTDQGDVVTQYEMHAIEKLGLLKVDIWASYSPHQLTLTAPPRHRVRHRQRRARRPGRVKLLQRGDVDVVFSSSRKACAPAEVARSDRSRIVALIALYRPGADAGDRQVHPASTTRATSPTPCSLSDVLGDTTA